MRRSHEKISFYHENPHHETKRMSHGEGEHKKIKIEGYFNDQLIVPVFLYFSKII